MLLLLFQLKRSLTNSHISKLTLFLKPPEKKGDNLQQLVLLKCHWLCNLRNRTVFRLIQEQCLEHVVVEGWVVAAGPFTVWTEVQLQDLRLHDFLTWQMIRMDKKKDHMKIIKCSQKTLTALHFFHIVM